MRIIVAFFSVFFVFQSLAMAATDVVLTLDRSLSMKGNDPNRESISSAQLFVQLLGMKDRLALTTFAQSSERLLPLTEMKNQEVQQKLSSLIDSVQMSGIRTNFESALRVAYQIFEEQTAVPDDERVLVLFSDGQLNLGSEEANQAAHSAIVNDIIPKFQAKGIRILGVAFSPEADLDFLSKIAEATGGQAFRAEKTSDIYNAFVRLFEQTDQPLAAPIVSNEVKVDANVNKLKLLVKRDNNQAHTQITTPSGQNITSEMNMPNVNWQHSDHFDHVTIQKPEAGTWTVKADIQNKKAYVSSDLDLKITLPTLARMTDDIVLTAHLIYQGTPINPEIIKNTKFTATSFDVGGKIIQQLELNASATDLSAQDHRGALHFPHTGAFEVQVTATNPEFQRQKTRFITLVNAIHSGFVQKKFEEHTADAKTETQMQFVDSVSEYTKKRSAVFILVAGNLALIAVIGIGFGIWWWRRPRPTENKDDFDLDNDQLR